MHESDTMAPAEWERLTRYLAGEVSAEERVAVARWIAAEPGRAEELQELMRRWREVPGSPDHAGAAEAWQVVQARLDAGRDDNRQARRSTRLVWLGEGTRSSQRQRLRRGFFAKQTLRGRLSTQILLLGLSGALAVVLATYAGMGASSMRERHYATGPGEQLRLQLPDQSIVVLAPQTRLTVEPSFSPQTRSVQLTGEAYFEVRPGAHAPFVVRTGNFSTRVLGTRFLIRRYSSDSTLQVAVIEGRVIASGAHRDVIVGANMIAFVNDSAAAAHRTGDMQAYTAWLRGQIVFDNTPVQAVLETLEHWYGYRFLLADSTLVRERVTARFRSGARPETLAALCRLLDVTMTVDGSSILLRPRRATDRGTSRRNARDTFSFSPEMGK